MIRLVNVVSKVIDIWNLNEYKINQYYIKPGCMITMNQFFNPSRTENCH